MDTRYDYGGDEFIFVDFDIEMSLEVNFKVLSVCQEIERQRIGGLIEVCPRTRRTWFTMTPKRRATTAHEDAARDRAQGGAHRVVELAAGRHTRALRRSLTKECAKRFADRHQDASVSNLEYLMAINGYSSKSEFIAAHSGTPYWVSMIGFVPGTAWCFQMVSRDRAIQAPKYVRPRTDTPERAVSHGGVFVANLPGTAPAISVARHDAGADLRSLRKPPGPALERYILALPGTAGSSGRSRWTSSCRSVPRSRRHVPPQDASCRSSAG
jgi:urea carboxylase